MVRTFATDRDMFVFGQIGGPVTILDEALGMEDYMIAALENTSEIQFLSETVMTFEAGKAKVLLDAGADAILVGDDIAFNSGPFLPPRIMRQVVYPLYRWLIAEIKRRYGKALALIGNIDLDYVMTVPPANAIAMYETAHRYGVYGKGIR